MSTKTSIIDMKRFLFQRAIVRKTRITSGLRLSFIMVMKGEYQLTLYWKKLYYGNPSVFVEYNPAELVMNGMSVKLKHGRE